MKMNLLNMKGEWGDLIVNLYEYFISRRLDRIYEEFTGFFFNELAQGSKLLDLGCGSGPVACKIATTNPGTFVLGVDLSEAMIRRARERLQDMPNLAFERGDAMNLFLPPEYFDLAISVASIKHWPDQSRGLSEMRRVCKTGGSIWLVEADSEAGQEAGVKFVSLWHAPEFARPLLLKYFQKVIARQGMSAAHLRDLMISAGLEDIYIRQAPDIPMLIATGVKK